MVVFLRAHDHVDAVVELAAKLKDDLVDLRLELLR